MSPRRSSVSSSEVMVPLVTSSRSDDMRWDRLARSLHDGEDLGGGCSQVRRQTPAPVDLGEQHTRGTHEVGAAFGSRPAGIGKLPFEPVVCPN